MGLDELPDAVIVLDAGLSVVEANRAAEALTGFRREELVGRRVAETLAPRGPDGKELWAGGWDRSAHLRSVRLMPEQEVVLRRRDGTEAHALVTGAYRRDRAGRVTGAVVDLRDARRRATQMATGVEMVSTVSHELRSPLTSVKGYTSLLLHRWERLSAEDRRMMLEQVNLDADRVTRLVTELLDISRLQTGRLVLRRQPVELAQVAAAVVEKVRLAHPGLEAALSFPPGLPRAWADPDKVVQVLTNLVENACKYGSLTGLEVAGEASGSQVAVAVRDRGPGLAEEDLDQVFSKFYRRGGGKPTGSGLGLWISRGLVEAHGGQLTARNREGKGAEFRFTLPAVDLDLDRGGQGEAESPPVVA